MLPTQLQGAPYIAAMLLQAGIVIIIVRAAVAFYRYKRPPPAGHPPPVPDRNIAVPVCHDQSRLEPALQRWKLACWEFDEQERVRVVLLSMHVTRMTPLSAGACLIFFLIAPSVTGNAFFIVNDLKAIGLGLAMVGACTALEIHVRTRRYRAMLIPRPYAQPQPVFKPASRQQKIPPRNEPPPPPPVHENIRITSLTQAYQILGLPAGRVTLEEAKLAWRSRIG